MKGTIVLCIVGIASLFVSAQATPPSVTKHQNQIKLQIRQLNSDELQALMIHDTTTLSKLWSDTFVVTNPFNKFLTKQQVLSFVAADKITFNSLTRRIEYIRAYGNVVVVAGSEAAAWAGKMPLAGKTSELRFTSIWMRQGNSWQEIARHANIVSTK